MTSKNICIVIKSRHFKGTRLNSYDLSDSSFKKQDLIMQSIIDKIKIPYEK